jgi:CRP-like cAMP-binding protein
VPITSHRQVLRFDCVSPENNQNKGQTSMSDVQQLLKSISLFRGLNHEQLRRIAQLTYPETYHAADIIFEQDVEGDKMYVVSKGQVEIRVKGSTGAVNSVLILGQGQVFGEMALIDQGTRSATVVALQNETEVYAIAGDEFSALCNGDTAIGYIMMRNIAQDLSLKIRHQNFFL